MLGDSQRSRGRGEPGGGDGAARPGTLGSAGGVLGWIAIRAAAALAVALVLAATMGFLLQRADRGPVAAWARPAGHDALWMGHAWLDGRRSPADLARLAVRIRASGIRDVYVSVGELGGTGRVSRAAYFRVRHFLTGFHAMLPGVRVSAWLRGLTGAGHMNLADRVTRANIVAAAAAALRAGFGGVHYDLRPVASGDPGLLALLKATRALHPNPLSVSAPKLEPLPGLRLPAQLILGRPVFWTTGYLTDVAREVDQVAVRSYDTGMPFRSWYGGYVERETALALRAVPPRTELVMGLPAFRADNLGPCRRGNGSRSHPRHTGRDHGSRPGTNGAEYQQPTSGAGTARKRSFWCCAVRRRQRHAAGLGGVSPRLGQPGLRTHRRLGYPSSAQTGDAAHRNHRRDHLNETRTQARLSAWRTSNHKSSATSRTRRPACATRRSNLR